jgi:hypothetical protein
MKKGIETLKILISAIFIDINAECADFNFNFIINSSGADLYACDAGVYDAGLLNKGGSIEQSYLQTIVGRYNKGNDIRSASGLFVQNNTLLPPADNFRTAVYHRGFSESTIIKRLNSVIGFYTPRWSEWKLRFNLASDYYGASYFIDFCFRGSMSNFSTGDGKIKMVKVYDSVTSKDLVGINYPMNAQLQVAGQIVCEERNSPTDENWFQTTITDNFSDGLLGLGGGSASYLSALPTFSVFSGASKSVFGDTAETAASVTLNNPAKFCVIRYVFRENSDKRRLWDLNSAEFAIDLNVNTSH